MKYVRAITLLVCSALASATVGAEWKKFDTSSESHGYYDADKYKVTNGILTVSIWIDFFEPSYGKKRPNGSQSSLTHLEYDCRNNSVRPMGGA
jgi:hypothetical protein